MSLADLNASCLERDRKDGLVDAALDFDYIRETAAFVAAALADNRVCEANYQPGDGTRYPLVFVPLASVLSAPARIVNGRDWGTRAINGVAMDEVGRYDHGWALVSLVGSESYPIRLSDRTLALTSSYVAEKWNQTGVGSASLAILLRSIAEEWPS